MYLGNLPPGSALIVLLFLLVVLKIYLCFSFLIVCHWYLKDAESALEENEPVILSSIFLTNLYHNNLYLLKNILLHNSITLAMIDPIYTIEDFFIANYPIGDFVEAVCVNLVMVSFLDIGLVVEVREEYYM